MFRIEGDMLLRANKPVIVVKYGLNGVSAGLAYIVSQGNITATIIWFAITTGATAGLSYYGEKR